MIEAERHSQRAKPSFARDLLALIGTQFLLFSSVRQGRRLCAPQEDGGKWQAIKDKK